MSDACFDNDFVSVDVVCMWCVCVCRGGNRENVALSIPLCCALSMSAVQKERHAHPYPIYFTYLRGHTRETCARYERTLLRTRSGMEYLMTDQKVLNMKLAGHTRTRRSLSG